MNRAERRRMERVQKKAFDKNLPNPFEQQVLRDLSKYDNALHRARWVIHFARELADKTLAINLERVVGDMEKRAKEIEVMNAKLARENGDLKRALAEAQENFKQSKRLIIEP